MLNRNPETGKLLEQMYLRERAAQCKWMAAVNYERGHYQHAMCYQLLGYSYLDEANETVRYLEDDHFNAYLDIMGW